MALISKPHTFASGETIKASEHNSNFDTAYNEINGGLDNANIKASAGIVDTKLAQITTANKVAVSAIVEGDLSLTGVILPEQGSAPTTAASEGALYTKDTSGQPELFYREESDGDEVQITTGGVLNGYIKASNVYDSGYFSITTNTAYTKTHSLGTIKVIPISIISENSTGTARVTWGFGQNYFDGGGTFLTNLTTTQITIRTDSGGSPKLCSIYDSTGSVWQPTSGYYRIILIALD